MPIAAWSAAGDSERLSWRWIDRALAYRRWCKLVQAVVEGDDGAGRHREPTVGMADDGTNGHAGFHRARRVDVSGSGLGDYCAPAETVMLKAEIGRGIAASAVGHSQAERNL